MPSGVIRTSVPTAVLPASLSIAFVETQSWPARVNEYHDGSSHRSVAVSRPRRSWQLGKRLTAAGASDLLAFWQAHAAGVFYFYNPKECVPAFTPDPTGAAVDGRYRVRFASAWAQSKGLGLLDVPIELIEVLPQLHLYAGSAAAVGLFGTGVDAEGMPASGGSVDLHWTLVAGSADGVYPGPDMLVMAGHPGVFVANQERGAWISNRPYSGGVQCSVGFYTLQATFDLTGFDPATARIAGVWAVDNFGDLYLNDVLVSSSSSLSTLTAFDLAENFVEGVNTMKAVIENVSSLPPNPMGLLLSIEDATATLL